jgi:hypothetical protein
MLAKLRTVLFRENIEKNNYIHWFIGLCILLIAGFRLIRNFNAYVDISFDDEVQYMRYGIDLFDKIRNDWGPVYNIWYKFLSLFEQRPIELYFLNYKVVIILLPICLFSFLYVYGTSFFVSLWMGFAILVSGTNILTYPRISHVVVSFFFITLIINKLFIKSRARQYIIICFTIFAGAFARPELMLAFLLFAAFTLFYIIKYDNLKKHIVFALPFIAVMALLFFVFGLPAGSYKGIDRTYIAFCQHYTAKYILLNKQSFNIFIDWIAFSREQFPGCDTFIDILLKYPLIVIKGMFANIVVYILLILVTCIDLVYPYFIHPTSELVKYIIYVAIVVVIVFAIVKQRVKLFQELKKNKSLLLIMLIFMLPSMISSLAFFPRLHYSILLLPLWGFVIAQIIDGYFPVKRIRYIFILIYIALFIYKMPNMNRYNTPMLITQDNCPTQSYKDFIRKLNKNTDKPHVIFSNVLNLSMMIDKNFTDFSAEYDYDNSKTFIEQMKEHKVDYILQTTFLTQDRRLSKDSTWLNFIENPKEYGFKKERVFDGCSVYLLYKE